MPLYSDERSAQILVSLLKQHGVRNIVASPGSTNICVVYNLQNDEYFKVYSSVDERSAAYIACGLAAESLEPVVLVCTGATASRNYYPGLTEAYYRKLPVLVVTCSQFFGRVGRMVPQVTDRTQPPKDVALVSVQVPMTTDDETEWSNTLLINEAILAAIGQGGGPVHINLETNYSKSSFGIKQIKEARPVFRCEPGDVLPACPKGSIAIFVGAHRRWGDGLVNDVERFCEKYDAVVICDQTSNYPGAHRIDPELVCDQRYYDTVLKDIDLLVHVGEISGAYMSLRPKQVWRVSPDGQLSDQFRALSYVFQMSEEAFFSAYASSTDEYVPSLHGGKSQLQRWRDECDAMRSKLPELPFSNIWVAQQSSPMIPEGAVIHFGILNSLRSWDFFEAPVKTTGYSNTGGFGIDGCLSSLIGSALASPEKPHFAFVGDLAFFYDMNSLGNRHVSPNARILVVNNGCGAEFKLYSHTASQFNSEADEFIAAAGHYGCRSTTLVKSYIEGLGFEYLSASDKEGWLQAAPRFFDSGPREKPLVFEVFTMPEDESEALRLIRSVGVSTGGAMKDLARSVLSDTTIKTLKRVLRK